MRHNRWVRIVALVVPLALVAAACSGSDDSASKPRNEKTTTSTTASTRGPTSSPVGKNIGLVYDIGGKGGNSFNASASSGLAKAKTDLGVTVEEREPNERGQNRADLVRELADKGSNLVFGVGFLFADPIAAVAKERPNTSFAIVDGVVDAPNVASLTFAVNEGSFLMGAAAALKSKTGKVGFIGGVENDLIKSYAAGFVAGAKEVKPEIAVEVRYLTQPPDESGFNAPAKAREVATSLYGSGIDVVYHATRGSAGGVFLAAKDYSDAQKTHVWVIGVDTDQQATVGDPTLQPYILTSMVKNIGGAVYDAIKRSQEGAVGGSVTTYDLKAGGLSYATSGGFIADIAARLDALKAKIIDGSIIVPDRP